MNEFSTKRKRGFICLIFGFIFFLIAVLLGYGEYNYPNIIIIIIQTILFVVLVLIPLTTLIYSQKTTLKVIMALILSAIVLFSIWFEVTYFTRSQVNASSQYENAIERKVAYFIGTNTTLTKTCILNPEEVHKIQEEECPGRRDKSWCGSGKIDTNPFGVSLNEDPMVEYNYYNLQCLRNLWEKQSLFGKERVIADALIVGPYRLLVGVMFSPFYGAH